MTFLVLLIAALGVTLLTWTRVASFNDRVSSASAASSSLFGPLGGEERVNVAVFGYGGVEHDGMYLTDSINILSIDPQSETTTMIAVPRDLWVEGVPALPQNGKVNEAFAAGFAAAGTIDSAAETAMAVLSDVTGLRIDHWMALDFNGFRRMIDAVGGVTVNNPTAFSYTWDESDFNAATWEGDFPAGEIHLNGDEALTYTRARYTSVPSESSDFARSVRQQQVLSALRAQLGDGGIGSIGPGLRVMDALGEDLRTDMSAIDLFLLSSHVDSDRRVELTEGLILTATTNTIGQYILVVIGSAGPGDYSPLRAYIQGQLDAPVATAP
ncbi:MAG: LCP family protein [Candidatus Limnocylindria bacterium]